MTHDGAVSVRGPGFRLLPAEPDIGAKFLGQHGGYIQILSAPALFLLRKGDRLRAGLGPGDLTSRLTEVESDDIFFVGSAGKQHSAP